MGQSGHGTFGVGKPDAPRQILDAKGCCGELPDSARSGSMARKGGGMMQSGADHGMMPSEKGQRREGMA